MCVDVPPGCSQEGEFIYRRRGPLTLHIGACVHYIAESGRRFDLCLLHPTGKTQQRGTIMSIRIRAITITALIASSFIGATAAIGQVVEPQTGEVAYKCTNLDGTTYYRAQPCPRGGWIVTSPQTGGGFSGIVQQEIVDRSVACQGAMAKRWKAEQMHRAQGRSMPPEFRRRLDQSINELCY